jgi:hypothetical protein
MSAGQVMPMLFSPTIGAAITDGHRFLWVRCPACRTMSSVDLRSLDRHRNAAVTSLIPALSCRSCRPNAPFETHFRLADPTEWSRTVTPEQAIRAASMIPDSLSIRFGWDDLAHKALQSCLLRRSA